MGGKLTYRVRGGNGVRGLAMAVLLGLGGASHAALIDRGNGLIYDDVLDITWLQDANYAQTSGYDADGRMTWAAAKAWVDQLVYEGYDDWRLPTLGPINSSSFDDGFSNNATTDFGYAKTTTDGSDGGWRDGSGSPVSEMGHMFYVNLGNLGYCTPNDASPSSCVVQSGWGLSNVSFTDGESGQIVDFLHVQSSFYWSGVEHAPPTPNAWGFDFPTGGQQAGDTSADWWSWAVRDGDIAAAPLPGTAVLMAMGLMGLGVGRQLRRAT